MSLTKVAGIITAIGVILGAAYAIDGRWVRCPVYAEGISAVQGRQLKFEQRSIQKDIYDIEDRLSNPRIPSERKAVYRERLRALQLDMKDILEERKEVKK